MSPDDPRHGTNTGYRAGCRCTACRRAAADAMAVRRKRQYLGRTSTLTVPNLGTKRRIQALVALGWSLSEVSRRAGYAKSHAALILNRPGALHRETAERIAAVYDDMSMTFPPRVTKIQRIDATRALNLARRNGWLPPLAYVDIDNPGEQPDLTTVDNLPDPVVVERILAGDWRLSATPTERSEVVARWTGTHNELARLTGWRVDRYRPEKVA